MIVAIIQRSEQRVRLFSGQFGEYAVEGDHEAVSDALLSNNSLLKYLYLSEATQGPKCFLVVGFSEAYDSAFFPAAVIDYRRYLQTCVLLERMC